MRSAIILLVFVILVSFQNCGFSGFITNLESVAPGVTDLSSNNGTTNLTTIPKGQLTHFDIPDQLVSLKLSIIEQSQNQILAYSHRLGKLVAFNPDGKSYDEISIPESGLVKIISVSAYLKFNMAGAARYLYRNPVSSISYSDAEGKIFHGVFGSKNRNWTRLDFPSDCSAGVRSSSISTEHLAFCQTTANTKTYYQKVDDGGQKIGSMIQTNTPFEFAGAKALSSNVFVSGDWTKRINLSTGMVSNLPASFAGLANWTYGIYRADSDTAVFLTNDYLSLIEKNMTTGQERTLMSSTSQFSAHGLDESLFLIYNQDTGAKYLVSSMAVNAVTTLNKGIAGYAVSNNHLALFTPDPISTTLKMTVQLFNVKTLAAVSMCSANSPAASDFYGNLIGYAGFSAFFTNSIAADPTIQGMNMAFVMDRTCNDVYLPSIFRTTDNETYVRKIYKYNVPTFQSQIVYTRTIPRDGMGYFGDYVGLDRGSLYFTLPNERNVYAAGNGTPVLIGTYANQVFSEPRVTDWNYSVLRLDYANGQSGYLLPLSDTGIANFSLPRVKSTPFARFLTNGGKNYVLVIKESDSDTSTTESYSFQFYNEDNVLIKKEKVNVNILGSSFNVLPQVDNANPDSPFIGIRLLSSAGDKVKYAFLIANVINQTVAVVEPSLGIDFSYDSVLTTDGNVLAVGGFCLVSRKQCISNPFKESVETASGNFLAYIDGQYYYSFYASGVSSLRRYSYDGNVGFTLVKNFGDQYGNFTADNRWLYFNNYTTKKVTLHNLVSGVSLDVPNTWDSVWPVKGGLLGFIKEANDTHTFWFYDIGTQKAQRIDDLSGGTESFYLNFMGGSLLNNKTSDFVSLYSETGIALLNLSTKKVVKRITMPNGSQPVWENGNQVMFAQTSAMSYFPAYPNYKYKVVLVDLKTFVEKEIDISKYSSFVCRNAVDTDFYCIGREENVHHLLKYNKSLAAFESIVELNRGNNFGGMVKLSKDLTFISFSAVNYVERYMVFPYGNSKIGQIGDGYEGYLYK